MALATQLAEAAHLPAVGDRIEAYARIVQDAVALPGQDVPHAVDTFVRGAVLERVNVTGAGRIAGRRALALLAARMHEAYTAPEGAQHDAGPETYREVLQQILAATHEHAVALEDERAELCVMLADAFEAQERWSDAVHALQGIAADTNRRSRSEAYWLRVHVRLLRLSLHAEALHEADVYLKRASSLLHAAAHDTQEKAALLLDFRRCQAEVYDRQLRCYDAALRFYELSTAHALPQNTQLAMLARALAAAMLAPVSAPRIRLLHQLQHDERAHNLPLYPVLALLADARIVRADTVAFIAAHLSPWHLAHRTHGRALDEAMVEHNVFAASRVYTTITLDSLAELVGLPVPACEAVVAQMIVHKRLPSACYIHQVANAVHFAPQSTALDQEEHETAPDTDPKPTPVLAPAWDAHEALRQCRDRRIDAALHYLSDAHAMLQETD